MATSDLTLISRAQAIAAGLKFYFTGKPCPHGHIAERSVAACMCIICVREQHNAKAREKRAVKKLLRPVSERKKAKAAGGLRYWTGYACENGHTDWRLTSTGQCMACNRMWQGNYFAADPEAHRAKKRARYARDPEKGRVSCARYYAENREQLNEQKRAYNHENLPRWREIEARHRVEDLSFRLQKTIRARILSALKRGSKCSSSMELLGCSIEEAKIHIEKQFVDGMSWDNWGKLWHLDHRIAIGLFNLLEPSGQHAAFHYTNLQPLSVTDHRRKSVADRKAILAAR